MLYTSHHTVSYLAIYYLADHHTHTQRLTRHYLMPIHKTLLRLMIKKKVVRPMMEQTPKNSIAANKQQNTHTHTVFI